MVIIVREFGWLQGFEQPVDGATSALFPSLYCWKGGTQGRGIG
jgi:hypothetical protein